MLVQVIRENGFKQLYGGAGVFCLSNASKSAVRFFTFDPARQYLPRNPVTGKSTPIGNLFTGMAAGVAESVAIVTPGENIKTKLIDGRNRVGNSAYMTTTLVIRSTLANEGLRGLYNGIIPVTLKQSSNAVVRFTSYNFLVDQARAIAGPNYVAATSIVAGGAAGIITVYCTMPMDNIKTRLQAIEGRKQYSGAMDCLTSMIREEGVQSLWKETIPRLIRLMVGPLSILLGIFTDCHYWIRSQDLSLSPSMNRFFNGRVDP